ncbi:MAG: phosphoribosyl-AMP cyclohydrolase [Acidimicrobiaceae bacterium]|nr:phosphoribosyl-AMP cyclohydrolase [Acidimicrobiaceae bacterium]
MTRPEKLTMEIGFDLSELRLNDQGLIPAIAVDIVTKEVLMMAWMNLESLRRTIETGRTWYFSRSRSEYWAKGDTSGNIQVVHRIKADCDMDTLLVEVDQVGEGACHTGAYSCFFRTIASEIPPGMQE